MNFRTLPGTALRISDLGLGTMTFGEQTTEADAHAQLDYARDNGINLIDAAEMYPVPGRAETQGQTESIVGRWLKRQARDQLVIATKITGPARGFHWIRGGSSALNQANIRDALEGSLRRLHTDYIDIYQIHWPARAVPMFGESRYTLPTPPDNATPIAEQLEALALLVQEGKIRYVGLSNETPWGVMHFLHTAQTHHWPRIVTIQNAYNLLNRHFETGLSEICHREQLGLLAYSPLAFGILTGKYRLAQDPEARLNRFPQFGTRYRKPMVEPATQAYADLAQHHGISLSALALGFVRSRFFTAATLIGARSLAQLKENLDAAHLHLDTEILSAIDAIHDRYPNPAP